MTGSRIATQVLSIRESQRSDNVSFTQIRLLDFQNIASFSLLRIHLFEFSKMKFITTSLDRVDK